MRERHTKLGYFRRTPGGQRNLAEAVVWALLTALVLSACTVSPLGRRQLKLFPEAQMAEMGLAAFDKIKTEVPQSSDPKALAYVRCVAGAITDQLPDAASWEVVVFEDTSANAFALPGGRIGVHSGLFKVASNQDQLAAVLGHEVAHVVSGHANERVSHSYAAQTGVGLVQVIAGSASPGQQQLIGLLGAGVHYGILMPYSRTQETEADLVGLDLMARAGFDPRESISLWVNMSEQSGGQPPEFLSTHPAHDTRIRGLRERMPSAMGLHEEARRAGKAPACAPR